MDATAPRIILGAGVQAQHVLSLMEWSGLSSRGVALYDDAYPKRTTGPQNLPIRGTLQEGVEASLHSGDPVVVALGSRNGALRYSLVERLRRQGGRLVSLIHPSCQVSPETELGQNVVMMPGCVVSARVRIGSPCCLFAGVMLEHDTQVADNVVFGPGVIVSGFVRIGMHAFLGAGAVCAPEVTIGERTLIGAGAVVVSDMPAGVIAIGVPARVHGCPRPGSDVPTLEDLERFGLTAGSDRKDCD